MNDVIRIDNRELCTTLEITVNNIIVPLTAKSSIRPARHLE